MSARNQMLPRQEAPEQRRKRLSKENQTRYRKKQMINNDSKSRINHINDGITRHELGIIDQICIHCGAKFWIDEKDRNSSRISPKFAVCCAHGKVHLPPLMKP